MSTSFSFEELAGAEACFAAASRLLYVEPSVEEVAAQVTSRLFANAPFAADDPAARAGLGRMDAWCADALIEFEESAAPVEISSELDASDGISSDSVEVAGGDPGATAPVTPAAPAVPVDPAALAASPLFGERVGALQREWLRLFAGVGAPEASCLESFYVEPNRHMFGKSTLAVREAYRAHGLQIERLHSEPDDHLGLMLGFVSHLVDEELAALETEDAAAAETAARDQERFLVEHVLPWLAVWRYLVKTHATSDYYLGAGDFVFGLVSRYVTRFGIFYDEEAEAFKRRAA